MTNVTSPSPGWYPDPDPNITGQRYWDGSTWTSHTAPAATQTPAPPAPGQPSGGPQWQPGPTPPPKQKNWFLRHKILSAILAVVLVVILAKALGGGGDDGTTASDDKGSSTGQSGDSTKSGGSGGSQPDVAAQPDNTTRTKNGPLTWGNWQVVGPMRIESNQFTGYDISMRVKNTGDAVDQGAFDVTLLKKQRILTTALCTTKDDVGPGQVVTVSCLADADEFVPGWTEITVDDSF